MLELVDEVYSPEKRRTT